MATRAVAALLLPAVAACAPERTQIVLVVDSDLAMPEPLARIDIEVASSTTPPTRFDLPLDAPSTPPLPLTLALYPRAALDVDVFVTVRGLDASGATLLARYVRTRFVPGSARMLRVLLAERCVDVRCGRDETCDETGCRGIAVAGEALPRWPGSPPALDGPACEPAPEDCNGADDDCDGATDEGIDFARDAANCGRCGHACASGACVDGYCPGERPVQIAAGGAHTCVRRERGTLACWGWNLAGQAGGQGAPTDALLVASEVEGIANASDVAAGGAHTCVLEAGAVRCFGDGAEGALGDGGTTDARAPVAAMGIADAVQVAAGAAHGCAVTSGGRVLCWGRNDDGQLGDGTTTDRASPVPVLGIADARAVAAGLRHSCAVRQGGQVACWGANESGQLGDGTTDASTTPVAVSGLGDAVAVGVGRRHSCALRMDGHVVCWGANESGQLGDGTTSERTMPVAVMGVEAAAALSVALAGTHACALLDGGQVMCWGSNLSGQLGDGTTATRAAPVRALVTDAVAVAAGGNADDGTGHACAIRTNGSVVCWGEGTLGRLGDGRRQDSPSPVPVVGLP